MWFYISIYIGKMMQSLQAALKDTLAGPIEMIEAELNS